MAKQYAIFSTLPDDTRTPGRPQLVFDPEGTITNPKSNVYTTWSALETAYNAEDTSADIHVILDTADFTITTNNSDFPGARFIGRSQDRDNGFGLKWTSSNPGFTSGADMPAGFKDLILKIAPTSAWRLFDMGSTTSAFFEFEMENVTIDLQTTTVDTWIFISDGASFKTRWIGDCTVTRTTGSGEHRLLYINSGVATAQHYLHGPGILLGDSSMRTIESVQADASAHTVYYDAGSQIVHNANANAVYTSHVNGTPKIRSTTRETATFTARPGELHLVDTSGGVLTSNLPPAADVFGRIGFKLTTAGNGFTIDGDGAETIDGATTLVLSAAGEEVTLESDGVEWHQVATELNHAPAHIDGGTDPIDGDKLEITWSPTNIVPDTTPTEADATDQLTAILAGVDNVVTAATAFDKTVQTTDATVTTIHSILMATNNRAMRSNFTVAGIDSNTGNTDAAFYARHIGYYRDNSATITQKFSLTPVADTEDQAAWDVTLSIGSGQVDIEVTGEAAKTIEWRIVGCSYEHG